MPDRVSGDVTRIRQVINNLVGNAVKFTDRGHVLIDISGAVGMPGKDGETTAALLVKVQDTGVGIAPYHLPRLTERFYRVDTGRSRAKGGTGLGLAIVKHVLLRHDAQLSIESEPGKGSVFRCEFPEQRRVACVNVPLAAADPQSSPAATPAS